MLFSDTSLLTMFHGIVLSGGALLALAAALYTLFATAVPQGTVVVARQTSAYAWLMIAASVLLWAAVLGGTYVVFPIYRLTPPEGTLLLDAYPRALLLSRPETAWLHSFAMEIKEHMPWIAAMLTTAATAIGTRYRATLFGDAQLRQLSIALVAIALTIVSLTALLGVFVNKLAPVW